jgi:uncharacterized protein
MKQFLILYLSFIIPMVSAQSILQDSHVQNRITLGQELPNIQLKNMENESREIPDIGNKVVVVFYTDPDCKDINDPLSGAVKNRGFKDKITGIGISNCADSWIPDALIRKGALKKKNNFPDLFC